MGGGAVAREKGQLREAMYTLVNYRTSIVTDRFVREVLGERNLDRMACLPPWVQRHVIATYGHRDGQEVKDPNKYFGGVIGGVRRLVQSGLTEDESRRMVDLAERGVRLSYKPCTVYGDRGSCMYGAECKNVHVTGISG